MIAPPLKRRIHDALDALPAAVRQDVGAALRQAREEAKDALATAPSWDRTLQLQGAVAVLYEVIPTQDKNR